MHGYRPMRVDIISTPSHSLNEIFFSFSHYPTIVRTLCSYNVGQIFRYMSQAKCAKEMIYFCVSTSRKTASNADSCYAYVYGMIITVLIHASRKFGPSETK